MDLERVVFSLVIQVDLHRRFESKASTLAQSNIPFLLHLAFPNSFSFPTPHRISFWNKLATWISFSTISWTPTSSLCLTPLSAQPFSCPKSLWIFLLTLSQMDSTCHSPTKTPPCSADYPWLCYGLAFTWLTPFFLFSVYPPAATPSRFQVLPTLALSYTYVSSAVTLWTR